MADADRGELTVFLSVHRVDPGMSWLSWPGPDMVWYSAQRT